MQCRYNLKVWNKRVMGRSLQATNILFRAAEEIKRHLRIISRVKATLLSHRNPMVQKSDMQVHQKGEEMPNAARTCIKPKYLKEWKRSSIEFHDAAASQY